MNTKKIIGYSLFITVFFAAGFYLSFFSFRETGKVIDRTQVVMGTLAEIKIKNEDEEVSIKAINAAFNEIKRIDDLFSTYNSDSPVWMINHSNEKRYILNSELVNFVVKCDSIWKLTKGAFDPALGSLTKAWGFADDTPSVPAKKIIRESLLNSGWENVQLFNWGIIKKNNILLDFGAIAKGYATDKATEVLKSYGIKNALVNIGGEIEATGEGWTVGIEHPRIHNLLIAKIKIKNYCVSTSGDYEKFFFEKDERYCHIFNPQTGYPADSCQSVTIINKNGTLADALSTACFVLGPINALKLINSLPDTEGLVIDNRGNQYMSNGFNKFLINED